MQVIYTKRAEQDKAYWLNTNNKIAKEIDDLVANIQIQPFTGLGKPERLRFEKSGYWSRRINHEHRLVYKVIDDFLYILQCRYHY